MDSGVSTHMIHSAGNLSCLKSYNGTDQISIGDGTRLHISHVGDKIANSSLKLKDVLVAPPIKKNLISVGQLTKDNECSLEFTASDFVVKDMRTKKLLARGTKKRSLCVRY